MSHSKLIIKGSALSVLQFLLQVIVAFFMMPFIIRHLGKELYGVWLLIAAFVGYYGLLDFGISGAVMRYVSRSIGAKQREWTKYYVSTAFFVLCAVGLIIIVISFGASFIGKAFITSKENILLFKYSVIIAGCTVGLSFPLRVFDGVLNANLRVDLKRGIEIGELIVRTILIVVILGKGYGVLGLAVVSALCMLAEFVAKTIAAFVSDHTLRIGIRYISRDKAKEMQDFAFFNFIQSIAKILSEKIDPYTVAYFANIVAVTYYGVALSLANYFAEFFRALLGILLPVLSQKEGAKDIEGIRRVFLFVSKLTIIMATFIGSMVVLYGKQFLVCWLGAPFSRSYIIMVILIVPMIVAYGLFPSVFILNSMERHRINTYLDIVQGITNLFLSIILGFLWKTIGIALGTAIPLLMLGSFAKSHFACKVIKLSAFDYWRKMLSIFLRCEFLIVPVWFVFGRQIGESYMSIFRIIVIHTAFFAGIGYFFLLSKSDMKLIKQRVFASIAR